MFDLAEPSSPPSSFNANTLDDRTDAELDALPFGVIGLDEEGTILRYNLYESRFARIDRNQVLGRRFFGEIAPCTRGEAFEGRFRKVVEGGAASDRFDFLFDFKFGAQHVSVDIVRAPKAPRYYLLINRQRVAPPRPEFPRELLAALQADLAPNEANQGVLRDDLERRFVDAPVALFAALRATCERLAPDAWQIFSTEWGVQWGRRAAVDIEASVLEKGGKSLRELPMSDVAKTIAAYLAERGWGLPTFDFAATTEGILRVDLLRSALAEAAPPTRRADGPMRTELACHIVAGCLSALHNITDRGLPHHPVHSDNHTGRFQGRKQRRIPLGMSPGDNQRRTAK